MSDERYERSADMRLLELQREAMGVPRRIIGSTSYTDPDQYADVSRDDDESYVQSGTILMASTDARPRTGLIPGALVTVSLAVVNEGDASADNVRMSLPLPVDTAYRAATLAIDGATCGDNVMNDIFSNGAELGAIEPGGRRTVTLKLVVEAGTSDIMLMPQLSVTSGAVLGLRAMRLTRKVATLRTSVIERPFYESDESEHEREPLAPRRPESMITVLQPREIPQTDAPRAKPAATPRAATTPAMPASTTTETAIKSPATKIAKAKPEKAQTKRETAPKPRVKPKPTAKIKIPVAVGTALKRVNATLLETITEPIIRPKVEVIRSSDELISFAGQGGPILAVRIDRKRLAMLAGLFGGPSLGMIAHYLVLNALAVRDPLPGDRHDDTIAAFVGSQEQLLSRALITTRLGKVPAADSIGAILPAFPPALDAHTERRMIDSPPAGEAVLFRAFEPREVAFVQRMLSNTQAAPFIRAAQLFVGLCANDMLLSNSRERHSVGVALTAYAALATGEISRIFLRAKLNRVPELFKATDPSFDDAARTVLTALGRSMT